METKEFICTICPLGCRITVRGDGNISTEGAGCKRGDAYAREEFVCPVRILTSTAVVEEGVCPLVSLRSVKPVPKALLTACMDEIRKLRIQAPVRRGDILIQNVLDVGADIVATGSVNATE